MSTSNALRLAVTSAFEEVPFRNSTEEICIVCPEPGCNDKSGNRGVNLKTGMTNCWKCGKGGHVVAWARRLGFSLSIDEEASADLGATLRELENLEHQLTVSRRVAPAYVADVKLPKGFKLLSENPKSTFTRLIGKMAERKNLSLEAFMRAGAGFVRQGKWEPFCVFPVREWGKVVYYQGRTYAEDPGEKTKLFPSRDECPLSSRHWVYNLDAVRAKRARRVIVVESILNVLSLEEELEHRKIEGVVPVGIFKSRISKEQAAKLAAIRGLEEINLMFDEDATSKAWEAAGSHASLDLSRVTVTEMPVGVDANDNAQEAVKRWKRRKKVSSREGVGDALMRLTRDL